MAKLKSHVFIDESAPHLKYVYQYFLPNGKLDKDAIYDKVSGRMMKNGRRYSYYPNGQLREITHYVNDKIGGNRKYWAANGTLIEDGNYKSGSRHGKFESWWENGQPKELSYHQGYYRNGPVLRWHRDGRLLEQGSYYQGKALGVATVWDTLGNLRSENAGSIEVQLFNAYYMDRYINEKTYWYKSEGRLRNGMRDGKWKFFYYQKGKDREIVNGLCTVLNYKKGVLHGKVTVYHPNGSSLLEARFKDGWLEGDYISWHETGDIAVKGTFKNHKKTGLWTRYHHQSAQIYTIRMFENDMNTETYKEWDVDGFLKNDRKDNKAKKQVEFYTFYKSGMKYVSIRPYGWKSMHYYEYDQTGYLKKTRIMQADNVNHYIQTEYYPNGQKSVSCAVVDGKWNGIYSAWYEDGSPKSQIIFENGKRHGTSYSWNEDGVKSATLFENGVQIIQNSKEEEALECACNHAPKEIRNGFMNWFKSYVPFEDVTQRTQYFTISEQSYKRLFSKNIRASNDQIYGTLAVVNDFYVEVHNGLRLDFTACRRGVNRTHLDINARYNPRNDKTTLSIRDFDMSVEFPQNLLRLYDLENKKPLVVSMKKYQKSSVRFEVKELEYEDENGIPSVEITQKKGTQPCFQISEIGTTGILFNGNNPQLDFSPVAFPSNLSRRWRKSNVEEYLSSDNTTFNLTPPMKHLNDFMGVYFPNGQLYIFYQNTEIVANAKNIFVDGKEIHGNIEIAISAYPSVSDTNAFLNFLAAKGFEVLETQLINEETLHIFWKYAGR